MYGYIVSFSYPYFAAFRGGLVLPCDMYVCVGEIGVEAAAPKPSQGREGIRDPRDRFELASLCISSIRILYGIAIWRGHLAEPNGKAICHGHMAGPYGKTVWQCHMAAALPSLPSRPLSASCVREKTLF